MNDYYEEQMHEDAKYKIKKAGKFVIFIGILLFAFGLYFVITAKDIPEPGMSDPNWFQVRKEKADRESLGMFMIIPSIFITSVGCMLRFIVGNQREITSYMLREQMPVINEMSKDIKHEIDEKNKRY